MTEQSKEGLLQQLRQKDKKKLAALVLLLVCGMVLLAYPYNRTATAPTVLPAAAMALTEEAQLEQRLQRVLQQIEGVGAVEVGVSFASGGRFEYALAEQHSSNGQNLSISTEPAVSGGEPLLVRQSAAELRGVVVVAEGAADPLVKERIYTAVRAMLGLQLTQIAVVEGKAKEAENE